MSSTRRSQSKDRIVPFRCSEGECQKIDKMARQSGKNRSRYIADKVLKEDVDITKLCMLLRTVEEYYYKSTGDKQFQNQVEEVLKEEGY